MADLEIHETDENNNRADNPGVMSRRLFSRGAALATGAVALSASGAAAAASPQTTTDPRPSRSAERRASESRESPQLEALASRWRQLESQTIRASRITRIDARGGAIAVRFEGPTGAFQVDVLRRDGAGPSGIATRGQLSFFLANRGDGDTSTHEEHGLTLMALSKHPEVPDDATGLMSWQERRTAFPGGAFLLS